MMGRAARRVNGHVVMYVDMIMGIMHRVIDDFTRSHTFKKTYNKMYSITAQTNRKAISESRLAENKKASEDEEERKIDPSKKTKEELKFYVDELGDQMDLAAKNLEFELAARIRDKIGEIN